MWKEFSHKYMLMGGRNAMVVACTDNSNCFSRWSTHIDSVLALESLLMKIDLRNLFAQNCLLGQDHLRSTVYPFKLYLLFQSYIYYYST